MKKEFLIIIIIIIIMFLLCYKKYDHFNNLPEASMSGTSMIQTTDMPLFLNMYPLHMGIDPKVNELIMKGIPGQTNGIFTQGLGQINVGIPIKPIIIIPGIGLSKIFAKWDLSQSNNVKSLDIHGNFETHQKWSCRTYQDKWTKVWGMPEMEKIAYYCWIDNLQVNLNGENKEGLISTTVPFGNVDYEGSSLNSLITLLESRGYVKNVNLFIAQYDMRLIGNEIHLQNFIKDLKNLIESMYMKKVTLIGHDLGAVLANIFLVRMALTWKNIYIDKFISIAGTFGGSPKAFRTLLTGSNNLQNMTKIMSNFSGIHLLLPNKEMYNDPLLKYNNKIYNTKDISEILEIAYGEECKKIYENAYNIQLDSLKDPNVNVYLLVGNNLQTESSYNYEYSLGDDPKKIYPYYNIQYGNEPHFAYNNLKEGINTNGDGNVPFESLLWLLSHWKSSNITYKIYSRAEHLKILSMNEPLSDILHILHE